MATKDVSRCCHVPLESQKLPQLTPAVWVGFRIEVGPHDWFSPRGRVWELERRLEVQVFLPLACLAWLAQGPGTQKSWGARRLQEGAWVLVAVWSKARTCQAAPGLQCEDVKPHGVSHGSLGARV